MKYLIFFLILALYFFLSWYVFSRGLHSLQSSQVKNVFTVAFWLLSVMFILGQIIERVYPGTHATVISFIGSVWLVMLLYALMLVLFIDIVRIFNHYLHFIPSSLTGRILAPKMLFVYVASIVGIVLVLGYVNAKNPVVKEIDIAIQGKQSSRNKLRIALVSDVHMGALIGRTDAQRLVTQINAQKVDIVCIAGDFVDHNPIPVIDKNLGEIIKEINAPMGVYAVTGNHEFLGHAEVSIEYFSKFGITYIRDTIITLDGIVQIAGREDIEMEQSEKRQRKSLEEILQHSVNNLPLILLDHQPLDYSIAKEHHVDLMFSGHTHKGQMWPLGAITNLVYENHYGLKKDDTTYYYTSSGYGTWGPPIRTGNKPELVIFNLLVK